MNNKKHNEIGSNSGVQALTNEQKQQLKMALDQINNSFTRKVAEQDLIKETIKKVSADTGLTKRMVRRLAKTYFNRDFEMAVQEDKDFESVYETVIGISKND